MSNSNALLYHTQSGAAMESSAQPVLALLQSLHEKKNLGAVYVEGQQLAREPYQSFIAEFCEKNMGGLADVEQVNEKPIQLMPILNVQREVEKLRKDRERSTGENILQYLLELNIYVNDACQRQCPLCYTYFRQSICCTKHSEPSHGMSRQTLQKILAQIQYAPVGKLNILGGDLSQCAFYEDLDMLLQPFGEHVHLWMHYANAGNTGKFHAGFKYDIPVTMPIDEALFSAAFHRLKKEQTTYHFFITGEKEYQQAAQLPEKHAIAHYAMHPVYTGQNLSFFEEQVYMTKEDIFSKALSFREIFAHQKLNTHFFGSLTVLSNGDVHANVNSNKLGNVETDSILDLINKEMTANTAWRQIRNVAPCSGCLYQYLCPSPSDYEKAIGKPNLCHLITHNQ
jgi:pseudo-rSAM protein